MDISRLSYFCHVVQTGSLREASELLGLSAPALSKAMKTLEDEMGMELIVPDGRGIAITDEGRSLAKRAEPLIRDFYQLKTGRGSAKEDEKLRLGSFEVFTSYLLGPLAKDFFSDKLLVHEFLPGEIEDALNERVIDVGITYLPIPKPNIEFLKVTNIRMGAFVRRGCFSNRDFLEIPFAVPINPPKGTPTRMQGLDGWPDHEVDRKIQFQVTMMESAIELVRQGVAAAYLPQFVVNLHNEQVKPSYQLEEIDVPKKVKRSEQAVYIVKRKSDLEDRRFKRLARALRKLCST